MLYSSSPHQQFFFDRCANSWMSGGMRVIKARNVLVLVQLPLTDAGEYQPVYDEFGAILLLILAFVHRYDMTYHDLGIGQDSFVAQLLDRGHHSIAPDDLTEEQGKQLCNWLRGLYDVDKEGLSNDVFSSCRPQDFYLIVPTLFSQTIAACSAEVLSLDTVKGGLECTYHPLLGPW
jgi:mediator of RNA polymerase II transcription subunit 5